MLQLIFKKILMWQKKKQRLIQNLFKNPYSEEELMNIILPEEIELCKSCKINGKF